uniref:Uncharacterized protein n=1 Tax=Rhizophora mucronata TaxID=61149 RepID=A0A2P2R3F9_RHIMU
MSELSLMQLLATQMVHRLLKPILGLHFLPHLFPCNQVQRE